jgi:hypothetical protein
MPHATSASVWSGAALHSCALDAGAARCEAGDKFCFAACWDMCALRMVVLRVVCGHHGQARQVNSRGGQLLSTSWVL